MLAGATGGERGEASPSWLFLSVKAFKTKLETKPTLACCRAPPPSLPPSWGQSPLATSQDLLVGCFILSQWWTHFWESIWWWQKLFWWWPLRKLFWQLRWRWRNWNYPDGEEQAFPVSENRSLSSAQRGLESDTHQMLDQGVSGYWEWKAFGKHLVGVVKHHTVAKRKGVTIIVTMDHTNVKMEHNEQWCFICKCLNHV